MSFLEILAIEFKKVKRSKLVLLILIPSLFVVISGVANIRSYFTPEYKNAWPAMFIQSALLFGYYLLPFSMIVVCVMIFNTETKNNGILKMLAMPISRTKMALAKFTVLLCYLGMEMVIFFIAFIVAGLVATATMGITETIPVLYLLKCALGLFITSVPGVAFMWMLTVLFEKPLLSIGLNMLLVIPGVLVTNTPIWPIYPYCYSGYLVSTELHKFSNITSEHSFQIFPFLPCAITIFVIVLAIGVTQFGKKEMK
ncbi:ABC transporter permease [Paenibacillus sp. 22594]|uniref:ABC transporter permease n=1 Tax=Paenibacillus sp. 22594 TaxID=3453947 RepID=UPI003F8348CF